MTALAKSQIQEMLERLDRVQLVCDAYAKHDEPAASALLFDLARVRHRLHGWLRFDDEAEAIDGPV